MLVLSRMIDERCVITTPNGDRIEVTVVAVRGGKVRIGVDAPEDVLILRGELEPQETEEKAA